MTETASIHSALLAFHAGADKLDLKKTAEGVHSAYLPLDGAMEQIRPLLAEHGLYARHYTGRDESGWFAGTIIVHAESGDSIDSGPFPLAPAKSDAQGWGGALTYARRYTLMEVLALVADTDDDGAPARRSTGRRTAPGKISAAQRREVMEAIRAANIPTDRGQAIVKEIAGVDTSADIPVAKFADVIKAIKAAKA